MPDAPRPTSVRLFVLASFASVPAWAQGLGLPPEPAENPSTQAKVDLGHALFWDEQLSTDRTVACGTCHIPAMGGSDPRSGPSHEVSRHPGPDFTLGTDDDIFSSPGITRQLADGSYEAEPYFGFGVQPQVGARLSPSMAMAPYAPELRWDGLIDGTFEDPITGAVVIQSGGALEKQSLRPLRSFLEMAHVGRTHEDVEERIRESAPLALATDVPSDLAAWIAGRDYESLYGEAFGTPEVTVARTAMALAAYQRSLAPNRAPFDDFLNGDGAALTPLELEGWNVFQAVGCADCHTGPELTDQRYYYIGVRPTSDDRGRFYATVRNVDIGKMRTPSLRNVELRGAYFHNGGMDSLRDVVEFFDRGGDFDASNKTPLIRPLGLSAAQKDALVAFLGRPLTDPRMRDEVAPFDRPTLNSETSRAPVRYGHAVAGTGGLVPRIAANTPPSVGVGSVTIGVDRGLAGAPAMLVLSVPLQGLGNGSLGMQGGVLGTRRTVLAPSNLGMGYASTSITLPDRDPAHVGTTLHAHWRIADPAAPGGWSRTEAVRFVWF